MLDLDSMLWHQPISTRNNSPSLQRHVGIAGPGASGVVWWGGMEHAVSDVDPGVTYSLEWVPPGPSESPISTPTRTTLPLASAALLGVGLVVCVGLFADFAIQRISLQRAHMKAGAANSDALSGTDARELEEGTLEHGAAAFSHLLAVLQAILGTSMLLSLAALAAAWGQAVTAPRSGTFTAAATAAAIILVLITPVVACVLAIRSGIMCSFSEGKPWTADFRE